MLGLFFVACHSNDDTWGDWSRGYSFSGKPRTGAVTFTLNGEVYVGLGRNENVEEKDKYLKKSQKMLGIVTYEMWANSVREIDYVEKNDIAVQALTKKIKYETS